MHDLGRSCQDFGDHEDARDAGDAHEADASCRAPP